MLRVLLAILFGTLLLLIMRVSHLNDKISSMDQQLSDVVTHDYLDDFYEIHRYKLTPTRLRSRMADLRRTYRQELKDQTADDSNPNASFH